MTGMNASNNSQTPAAISAAIPAAIPAAPIAAPIAASPAAQAASRRILNPLNPTLDEAEQLLVELRQAADRLTNAVELEAVARARAKDAADTLDAAVNDILLTDIRLADTAKEGALAGIAKTSKAYDIALSARRAALCSGQLAHLYADAARLRAESDAARMALDAAQARFSAVKHACDLKAMILRASVI